MFIPIPYCTPHVFLLLNITTAPPPLLHLHPHHLPGRKTSHPSRPFISSGSSSIKFLPPALAPPLLPVLKPVPVLGGSGGLSSPSIRLPTGFLSAIERLGGGGCGCAFCISGDGSSRYCACGGGVDVLGFDSNEGFLVGMGGGAALRRTCGPFLGAGCGVVLLGGGSGRVGRERVDALDGARPRSFNASRLPSKFEVWVVCVGKGGTMSFLPVEL
jgi:hypothetical protein